jgi:hypothetical protein
MPVLADDVVVHDDAERVGDVDDPARHLAAVARSSEWSRCK